MTYTNTNTNQPARYMLQSNTQKFPTKKLNVAEIKLEAGFIELNDELLIIGPTTGVCETNIQGIRVDLTSTKIAKKGCFCSIKTPNIVRKNDKVYKIVSICDSDDYEIISS